MPPRQQHDAAARSLNGLRTRSTAWATLDGKLKTVERDLVAATSASWASPRTSRRSCRARSTTCSTRSTAASARSSQALHRERQQDRDPRSRAWSASASTGRSRKSGSPPPARSCCASTLYGPDQAEGGGDDSLVGIGRSWARINRDLPAGVMQRCRATAPTPQLLDGVVKVGKLGEQPLPCNGTEGEIYTAPTRRHRLRQRRPARRRRPRRAAPSASSSSPARPSAWTEGSVANLQLGPARAPRHRRPGNVKQNKSGEIVAEATSRAARSARSSSTASPRARSTRPPPARSRRSRSRVSRRSSSSSRTRRNRGMKVSAVVITMLPEHPRAQRDPARQRRSAHQALLSRRPDRRAMTAPALGRVAGSAASCVSSRCRTSRRRGPRRRAAAPARCRGRRCWPR